MSKEWGQEKKRNKDRGLPDREDAGGYKQGEETSAGKTREKEMRRNRNRKR